MTTWDKIYKNYQQGGAAWASLAEDIYPQFIKFIQETNFKDKNVLDIGCGTGNYLKLLQSLGFKTTGIDSSQTAIQMTKKLLADDSKIEYADMFKYQIAKNKYDLIISIASLHHGLKTNIQKLVNQIYDSLLEGGNTFITVPDYASSKKWNTFKNNTKISEGTYTPNSGPEKGLPHSFYTKTEIEKLFSQFQNIKLELDKIGYWFITVKK